MLLAAQSQSEDAARRALTAFCQDYWPPLYTFLRQRGYPPSDAQDLVQGFFVHLMEQNTLSRIDPEKGLLRSFLLRALQYFLANEYHRVKALKRGGGHQIVSMDDELVEAEAALGTIARGAESSGYDRHWAANLVSRAWEQLHRALVAEGKKELVEALKPFVVGGTATYPPQEEVAAGLGMQIATFRNTLWRVRQRYRESVRAEVARTVSDASKIDEEMRYLLHVLLS